MKTPITNVSPEGKQLVEAISTAVERAVKEAIVNLMKEAEGEGSERRDNAEPGFLHGNRATARRLPHDKGFLVPKAAD